MRPINLIAALIIENGKIYEQHRVCQGNCETGPTAFSYYGYRWGRLYVELQPNGTVYVGWKVNPILWTAPDGSRHVYDNSAMRSLDYSSVGASTVAHKLLWLRKRSVLEGLERSILATGG